jgi:hypothetical protein
MMMNHWGDAVAQADFRKSLCRKNTPLNGDQDEEKKRDGLDSPILPGRRGTDVPSLRISKREEDDA